MLTGDMRTAMAVERWARDHRDELVHDLISLISIRSVAQYGENGLPMGSGCKQALDAFSAMASSYGLDVENDDNHAISVLLPGKSGHHELGILGHLDVVPEGTGWKYAPYAAVEKNGFVIGRGACDNKGPVVMALHLLRCLRDLNIPISSRIRLIAGCDEEKEMRDIRHYLAGHPAPAFTLNCDGAWPLCIGEKGILTADLTMPVPSGRLIAMGGGEASNMVPASAWAVLRDMEPEKLNTALRYYSGLTAESHDGHTTLRVAGKAAHCAAPGTGINAIRRLIQILCAAKLPTDEEIRVLDVLLKIMQDDEGTGLHIRYADPLSGPTTAVGSLLSMHCGQLRLHINVRFAVTQPIDLLQSRLLDRCESLGLRIENLSIQPPRLDSPDQPEVRLLLDTARELIHRRLQPYVAGGGTHSRLFPRSVPFGTGFLGKAQPFGGPHAADEAVNVEELIQGMKIYAVALLRLDRHLQKRPC